MPGFTDSPTGNPPIETLQTNLKHAIDKQIRAGVRLKHRIEVNVSLVQWKL